jgi:hypothetical protein
MAHWYSVDMDPAESRSRAPDYTQEGLYVHGVLHAHVPFNFVDLPSCVPIVPVPRSLMAAHIGVVPSPTFTGRRIMADDFADLASLVEDAGITTAGQAAGCPLRAPENAAAPHKPTVNFPAEPAPVPPLPQLTAEVVYDGESSKMAGSAGTASGSAFSGPPPCPPPPMTLPSCTRPKGKKPRGKPREPTIIERVKKADIEAVMHLPLKKAADLLEIWYVGDCSSVPACYLTVPRLLVPAAPPC